MVKVSVGVVGSYCIQPLLKLVFIQMKMLCVGGVIGCLNWLLDVFRGEWITYICVHVYGETELHVCVHVYGESELHVCVCVHGSQKPFHGRLPRLSLTWGHSLVPVLTHRLDWLASKLQGSTSLLPALQLHICTIRISCMGVGVVYTCVPVCGSQKSMLSSSIVVHLIFFWNCLTLNLELANLSWVAAAELIFYMEIKLAPLVWQAVYRLACFSTLM